MNKVTGIAATIALLNLSGCASFKPPYWSGSVAVPNPGKTTTTTRFLSLDASTDVEYYLDLHVAAYDGMIEKGEIGRVLLELPVVVSSVAIPGGLALGKSDKFAIRMATVGIAGSAGSTWIQPRQRLGHIVKAREAVTCIRREFNFQKGYEQTVTTLVAAYIARAAVVAPPPLPGQPVVSTMPLTAATLNSRWNVALGLSSADSQENARIAVGAADDVVSRLKHNLVEVGSLPDFSASLAAVRTQYENAQTKAKATTEAAKAFSLVTEDQSTGLQNAVQKVKEYPARVAECVAKVS